MIHLYESMKIGYGTLQWSAEMTETDTQPTNKFLDSFLSFLSIVFAIGLFFYLPLFFTHYIENIINQPFLFNIASGMIRITIFLLYLILISQLQDVKRLFQYHGAEHKVVYNFESGTALNIQNAKTFPTQHPRCGTSFVFIIMFISSFTVIILSSFIYFFGILLSFKLFKLFFA